MLGRFTATLLLVSINFAHAAPAKVIAYLGSDALSEIQSRSKEISTHLGRLGHLEGKDFTIWTASYHIRDASVSQRREEMRKQIDILFSQNPAIVYAGNVDVLAEAKKRSSTIPIVFSVRSNLKSIL